MDIVTLAGIIKIELPTSTLYLSDGGVVTWGSETYTGSDDTFGSIGQVDSLTEGAGDEIPALKITMLPQDTAAAVDISQPGFQGSRIRMWIGEVVASTGAVTGTPELLFDGQMDTIDLVSDSGTRVLEIDVVSNAERLFLKNEGNSLNPRAHKDVWSGETGEDNATGLGVTVAWGAAAPPLSGVGTYGGGGGSRFVDQQYVQAQ